MSGNHFSRATLEIGAECFYAHLVDKLGVADFGIDTPFPGGDANAVKRDMALDVEESIAARGRGRPNNACASAMRW